MLKKELEHIICLLDEHIECYSNHKESCMNLKKQFISLQEGLQKGKNVNQLIYWCKWFAPRIIFDGIGDKKILKSLEKLNSYFSQLE